MTNTNDTYTTMEDRYQGCLMGLAIGDALGTTLEFTPALDPFKPRVTDLVGGGPFNLKPGEWTDDTSMALCLADSLITCRGFDPADQMRRYVQWMDNGLNSVKGYCFDIGGTTSQALRSYKDTGKPYSGRPDGAGNGALMRLAPAVMAARNLVELDQFCADSSRTTHGAVESINACRYFGLLVWLALNRDAEDAADIKYHVLGKDRVLSVYGPKIDEIAEGSYKTKMPPAIVGSGYVVKSLEAALWACWHGTDYKSTVILAANLGRDSDTTAAIAGMLAGAMYGVADIPLTWRRKVAWRDQIIAKAVSLMYLSNPPA